MEKEQFVYVTYIRTTPEKLWQALREPEFTRQYWLEHVQESDWKAGAAWRTKTPAGEVKLTGEILEIDPPRRLVFTWRNEFSPEARAEGHSRVTYTLEPQGASVKLTVLHEMDRRGTKLMQGVAKGWPLVLASLKSLLETGEPLAETRKWVACQG
jgi:uncharacterized protein YndB with AHSA1/START domain